MSRPASRPSNPPLLAALRADAAQLRALKGGSKGLRGTLDVLALPGFWTVVLWRLGNRLHEGGLRPLSRVTYFANMVLFGADLPAGAVVGPGVVVPHPVGVAMASDVVLGARCRVMQGVGIGGSGNPSRPGHPVIGDDVWLLHRSSIFGPVHVGNGSVVGAGVTLAQDVPAGVLVLPPKAPAGLRFLPRTDADAPAGAGLDGGGAP